MSSFSVPSSSDDPAPHAAQRTLVVAPPAWRAIDFISDLHLAHNTPATAQGLARYLQACDADAIFILGDLFEVWIGDDFEGDALAVEVMASLRREAQRRYVGFMVGNRDFLLSPSCLAAHDIKALHDPCVLEAFGQRVLLSHGDALCLDDHAYQAFRRQVRSAGWQHDFLARPRAERAAIARGVRDASEARKHAAMPDEWADADGPTVAQWMQAHGSLTLVHGHTHRPALHAPAGKGTSLASKRHVLSDWDLDTDARRAEVLRLTAAGFSRITPPGIDGEPRPSSMP